MKASVFAKRMLCLLTAAMLLAGCLVSCGKNEPATGTDTSDAQTASAPTTQVPDEKPNITDKKFNGEAFNIAYMTGSSYGMGNEVDYSFEESETTRVSSAVYERNRLTEERLGVTIDGTFFDPALNNLNTAVLAMALAGDGTYDAIVNYLTYNYQLAAKGALLNIKQIGSFCLDNPWWDQDLNENFSFFGTRQFFATGDICIDDDCTTEVILFSKKLETDYHLPDHYETVRSGSWTLERMIANMNAVTGDLNGDGAMDKNDRFGMGMSIGGIPAFMVYFGAPSMILDEDGIPRFACGTQPETTPVPYGTLFDGLIANPSVVFVERELAGDYSGAAHMFYSDLFLYKLSAVGGLHDLRDEMDDGFGVLPPPKLDERQEKYYSAGSPSASTYALPISVKDPETAGAVLNVMGYYSVENITEYVIQSQVMIRDVRDKESEEMLRIALSDKAYDVGFCLKLGNYVNTLYDITRSRTNTFASSMESIKAAFDGDVNTLIRTFSTDLEPEGAAFVRLGEEYGNAHPAPPEDGTV